MVTLKPDPVTLSEFANLGSFHTEGGLLYADDPDDDEAAGDLYDQFKAHPDPRFSVYRRAEVPTALHFDGSPREGDPVIIPNGAYTIRANAPVAGIEIRSAPKGGHGFDPHTMPEMKAIFFAEGPDVQPGTALRTFENIGVYPFLTQMLGLKTATVDGKINPLQNALSAVANKSDPVVGPRVIHIANPKVTKEARAARVSGSCIVIAWIEPDGRTSRIHVAKSLGYGLDQNAMEAVSKYRFKPAMQNGVPIAVEINIDVHFQNND